MLRLFVVVVVLLSSSAAAGGKAVRVRATVTKTGKLRQSHYRSAPDKSKANNWSTRGNTNPTTGKRGAK